MNEFGLIMENWRQYIDEGILDKAAEYVPGSSARKMKKELPPEYQVGKIETVGQFKKFVKVMQAKDIGKKAAGAIIAHWPFGATIQTYVGDVKNLSGLLKKLYQVRLKKGPAAKTGTGLDALSVEPNVSKIVDDPIEEAFLNYLINDHLKDAPDDTPLENYNATELLQKYIATNFDNVTVKK